MIAKILVSFSLALVSFPLFAQNSPEVTEERLNQCYQQYPFFMEALILVSDEDFANATKSQARKKVIQTQFDKKSSEIRLCLDDMIKFAKRQGDEGNTRYVVHRMSEISSIAYKPVTKSKEKAVGAGR